MFDAQTVVFDLNSSLKQELLLKKMVHLVILVVLLKSALGCKCKYESHMFYL